MKMNLRPLLLLIIFGVLVVSCKKDEEQPKILNGGEFVSGKLRMFTNKGEVTDPKTIEHFSESVRQFFLKDDPNVYSFNDDVKILDSYNAELVLFSNDKGRITSKLSDKSSYNFYIQRKDGVAYFALQDTIEYYSMGFDERYKCTPIILEKNPLPSSSGYSEYVKSLRTLYGKEIGNEVHFTIISIMEKKYFNGNLSGISIKGAENNMINESYLSKIRNLPSGWVDTIVYKESHIVFK